MIELLKENGWSEIDEANISPPKRRSQGWLATTKRPENTDDCETYVYECGNHTIKGTVFRKAKGGVEPKERFSATGWARQPQAKAEEEEEEEEEPQPQSKKTKGADGKSVDPEKKAEGTEDGPFIDVVPDESMTVPAEAGDKRSASDRKATEAKEKAILGRTEYRYLILEALEATVRIGS